MTVLVLKYNNNLYIHEYAANNKHLLQEYDDSVIVILNYCIKYELSDLCRNIRFQLNDRNRSKHQSLFQ